MNRKALIEGYKARKIIGGICAVENTATGKRYITLQTDITAYQNRFSFSKITGSCVEMKLQGDWHTYGAETFKLEVLETLEKNEEQTMEAFKADLAVLLEMTKEKIDQEMLY